MVIVSTASPYKFNGSVLEALEETTAGMDEFQLLETLQDKMMRRFRKDLLPCAPSQSFIMAYAGVRKWNRLCWLLFVRKARLCFCRFLS